MFVRSGLYSIVRCPNYFGEILLWTGSFTICFGADCTTSQWIIASLGYAGIIYVMFSGARRLELRQAGIYGNNPEFREYIRNTPLIIPFLPIYSVAKHEWLKAKNTIKYETIFKFIDYWTCIIVQLYKTRQQHSKRR
jgi:hypothetical protein